MPIHDWPRVPPGLFHDFHQAWTVEIRNALNRGLLPKGYYALVEQRVDGPEPDVIAVEMKTRAKGAPGGIAATLEPPKTSLVSRAPTDAARYARKANRIGIHHPLGDVVAVIEIVSPGNKDTRHAIRAFVQKSAAFLRAGVHLLIVDLFAPTPRDPGGIHKAVFDEFQEQPFEPPPGKPLTLVSQVTSEIVAHIEPVAVGDPLPAMPLFLTPEAHVVVPLEETYGTTWELTPELVRELVQDAP